MKRLKIIAMATILLFGSSITIRAGQIGNLILLAEVVEVPYSSFYEMEYPPKGALVVVKYKVIIVFEGRYGEEEIKIAHDVSSSRKLRVGESVMLEVKRFEDMRDAAEVLRELGLEFRSEESITDYVFLGFRSPCPTTGRFTEVADPSAFAYPSDPPIDYLEPWRPTCTCRILIDAELKSFVAQSRTNIICKPFGTLRCDRQNGDVTSQRRISNEVTASA